MDELFAGWRLALRRLAVRWRLWLVAAAGILLAATLLAAGPLYTDAMSDLGLRFRLDRGLEQPRDRVVSATIEDRRLLGDPAGRARAEALDRVTAAHLGWLGSGLVTEDRTAPVAIDIREDGERPTWTGPLVALSGLESETTVTEGRLPGPPGDGLEVVLPEGFQRHVPLGATVRIAAPTVNDCPAIPPSEDDEVAADEVVCRPSTFAGFRTTATVVGFVAPNDLDDPRWQLFAAGWEVPDGPFTRRGVQLPGEGELPLLTTGAQYLEGFATALPLLRTTHRVGLVPDLDRLAIGEVDRAIDELAAWRVDVNEELGLLASFQAEFGDQLAEFRNAESFSRVPLIVILLQVAGVVLFFVVLVMQLLLDAESEEASVLRSRGASAGQLVGLTLLEGLAIAIPAALIAPWLAAGLVASLGRTPVFEGVTGGEPLPVAVGSEAALLAAAGAGAALLGALVPATFAAGRSIVLAKRAQSRPSTRGLVQRYYLDVGVVAVAALLLWQLDRRETVFDPRSVGGWSGDPLLLAAPLVLTLAAAAIVLRLYPPLLRLGVRALLRLRGTSVALGLRAAGRAPGPQARLVLLLVMAISVGTFAASYAPTVSASFEDRERYAAGVDLRGTILDPEAPDLAERLEAVRALDGVRDAVLAQRTSAGVPRGGFVTLLGVDDVSRAASMLWFRDDFAARPLEALLGNLQALVPPGGGLPLPADAVALEVQLSSEAEAPLVLNRVTARFRDANGELFDSIVDRTEGSGWLTSVAPLPNEAVAPLTLLGFHIGERARFRRPAGELLFDDIAAIDATGARTVLEDFEGDFGWTMYSQRGSEETFGPVSGDVESGETTSGEGAAAWSWVAEQVPRERVLALDDPAAPLNALLDERAAARLGGAPGRVVEVLLGDAEIAVPLRTREVVELFPTLDPGRGFVVVNQRQLRSIAGVVGADRQQRDSELWVDFEDGLTLQAEQAIVALLTDEDASPLALLPDAVHQRAMLAEVAADPTLQSAGSGILVVGAGAAFIAAAMGLLVALAVRVRERLLEFAVLRAIGTTGGQLLRSLLLEWLVVLALGVLVGVLLGRVIAGTMLSFLEVTDEGARVLPPFILETDWSALALIVAALAVLLLAALLLSWRAVLRDAEAQELRRTQ